MNDLPTLTRKQELIGMISDDYKVLYGVRPRFRNFDETTEAELEAWHAEICESIREQMAYERAEELAHQQAVAEAMTRKPWTIGELLNCGIVKHVA